MNISATDYALWTAGTALEALCSVLIWRRGLQSRLPFFTIYIHLVLAADLAAWWIWHTVGYGALSTYYIHWGFEAALLAGRWLVIAEICRDTLGPFAGIWRITRLGLAALAAGLVAVALGNAWGAKSVLPEFIYTAQRGLELAVLATILTLLGVCRYYRVSPRPITIWIALGLGLFAAVQVSVLGLIRLWTNEYLSVFNAVRVSAFLVALVIWCWAVWRASYERVGGEARLPNGAYEQVTPQVNEALQKLNSRLLEILRR